MQDPHDVVDGGDGSLKTSTSSTSTQLSNHPNGNVEGASTSNVIDASPPTFSPSVAAATTLKDNIPSSNTIKEEISPHVDISSSYESDMMSTTQHHDGTTTSIKSIISWQQLNETIRSELFYEGKSPMWREEWFGVHLPPSAVARGAPTIGEGEVQEGDESLLSNQEMKEEKNDGIVDEIDELEDLDSEVVIPVKEPPPPPPPPKQTLPIVNSPPVEEISQAQPSSPLPKTTAAPSFSLLSTLLSTPGPTIPLYPLLLLLTTLLCLKQTLHCLFGFKSRTRVTRSVNRVLLNKKQFVIPKDQLLQHIEWMRLRSDLRRMRERRNRRLQGWKDGLEEEGGGGSDGGGGGGMNSSHGDISGNSGGGGGMYRDNEGSNNRKDNNNSGNNGNDVNNGSGQNLNMLGLLKADDICPTRKILMLAELFAEVMGKKDKEIAVLNSQIEKNEQIIKESSERTYTLEMQLAEVTSNKENEVAMLKSKISEIERAHNESCKKATTYETQCKEMQEQVSLLKDEVAMLDLVCERMQDDELEGLEIEGDNCLRSCLGSLTNVNEEDGEEDSSLVSTDSEWDRLEDENKLLQAENELLQESLDCLRKELDEARSDAASVSLELVSAKPQRELSPAAKHQKRDLSPSNDSTMEMTDDSFEGMGSNTNSSTPPFEATESPVRSESVVADPPPHPLSPTNSEVINTIQTLLKKCAQDTQRSPEEEHDDSPNQNLNQDLLQLLANVRKLDGGGDHSKENIMRANSPRKRDRTSSPRKRDRTRDRDTSGRGRSRQRTGIKERSKILFKSPLARIRERSGRKSPTSVEEIAK